MEKPPSKKAQITSLYTAGITDVEDLALITRSRPSYVASVLHTADLPCNYFDLYTTTSQPMNVYSKFFAGELGYRDVPTAQRSVDRIDLLYHQFEASGDRAGQHHALLMALTMFDRARWTNKPEEADIFRRWMIEQLTVESTRPDGTVEHDVVNDPPARTYRRDRVVRDGPGGATLASRVVTFLFGILQALLILRIILLLLVANPGNDIVNFVLGATDPFVEPFRGMFSLDRVTADQGSTLDVAAIVALVGWTLIEAVILAGIRIFSRRTVDEV